MHLSDQHQVYEEEERADDEDEDLVSSRFTKQLRKQVAQWGDETLDGHKLELNEQTIFCAGNALVMNHQAIEQNILRVCQHWGKRAWGRSWQSRTVAQASGLLPEDKQ